MISFKRLGEYGRFGNQLFQYAYLRTQADRLGVKFYCPHWVGDDIFHLRDESERAENPEGIDKTYIHPRANCGFHQSAIEIQDGTDVCGNYQSSKYFKDEDVRMWYAFKGDVINPIRKKFDRIDFAESAGLHLRFGDMKDTPKYLTPKESYYKEALAKIKHKFQVLVFSDDPSQAKEFLTGFKEDFVFIEGNKEYEDLYLMALCRDFICSISTLSWWGAWLNEYSDKRIITPKEWTRPGYHIQSADLCQDKWMSLSISHSIADDYRYFVWKERLQRVRGRSLKENLVSLGNVTKNMFS